MNKARLLPILTSLALSLAIFMPLVQADNIDSRIAKQAGRIGKLNSDKKLSAAQAAAADDRNTKISEQKQAMLAKHNGKLTARDRAKLNRELNRNAARMNGSTPRKNSQ